MSDNTMITVYPFNGSLYSFYESPFVYRIEPNSLETMGLVDMGKLGMSTKLGRSEMKLFGPV